VVHKQKTKRYARFLFLPLIAIKNFLFETYRVIFPISTAQDYNDNTVAVVRRFGDHRTTG
jgi:hypothetical protein